jgi:CheY-like chemotaxis protein
MSALSGKRILIVDDNKTNREILQQQTKSLNMIPIGAVSGPAAIELFNQGAIFDLAILDFHMPEMDGLMLAVEIRKLKNGKNLPLILLSSFGYREKTDDFSIFSATLTKPIKSSQLHNALLTVLKKNGSSPEKKPEYIPLQYDVEIGKQHPLRVLLAEDNIINQKVALRTLEKIGYRADIAFNGLEVLDAMKRQVYDIVLMDIQMPEMDGVQATIQIRKEWPQEQQPRIIAVTANAVKEDHDKYLTIGVNDYLIKPFKIEDLVKVLLETQPLSNKGSEVAT